MAMYMKTYLDIFRKLEVDLFDLSLLLHIISNQPSGIVVYTKGEIVSASKRQHPIQVVQEKLKPLNDNQNKL
jgi:hypothetical protein